MTDTAVRSNILKDKGVVTEDTTTKSKILKNIGKIPEETVTRSKRTKQPKIKTWNYD